MKSIFHVLGVVIIILFISGVAFYFLCLNHVSLNEIGVAYNSNTGAYYAQETGWHRTSALTKTTYISTLPIKVTIPSQATIIVTKIVRFKPEGLREFIGMQGFSYSMNNSLQSIMLGYAFSGNKYSFLEIMQEATQETVTKK